MFNNKKKALAMSVLCAIASVGFVMSASAEETMTGQLNEVVVEGSKDVLPGGMVASKDRVGILGEVEAIDVPFTQKKYTEKTIDNFSDPNQPMNGVLANNPSIRIGSPSPMYTDFNMRGVNMNAAHYYINGIPNMFNQTRSIPAYVLESVEIVSGPNTVLNGATFSNNGTNGTDAPVGMLNGITKKATDDPIIRYTQSFSGGSTYTENLDVGRRFGENKEWGVRVNSRLQKGGLSIHGAEVDDKTIYLNIDHKDEKSSTNIFGGYFDWKVDGGQRWLSATNVKHLADAPNGKNNLSFDGQTKQNHGYLMTINHLQKFSDKWSAYANIGTNYYRENKNDPNSGSWTLGDYGKLSGKYRNYKSESRGLYTQFGVANDSQIGKVKNNLSVAVDYFNYKSKAVNSGSEAGQTTVVGDIWNGVKLTGTPIGAASIDTAFTSKEEAKALTIADRVELGKVSFYTAAQYRDSKYKAAKEDAKTISKDSLNPSFAIAYKPIEKLSVYTSYAQSYTRPVEVSKGYDNEGQVFEPIKNKQTEIGLKYDNAGVLHSFAIFDLNQASYIKEASNGPKGQVYTQEGENRFKGMEYSIAGKVSDKWNLMGGLMYLNGKREKLAKGSEKLEGKFATGAPKWNAVLAAEYEATEDTTFIGRVNYTGKSHVNDNGVMTDAFATVDFGVKHKTKINTVPVTLSAMCYNLFGENYWISRGTSVALGAPRTFMLSAQFDI